MWGTYTIEKYVEIHMQRNKAYMDKHIQKRKDQGIDFLHKRAINENGLCFLKIARP